MHDSSQIGYILNSQNHCDRRKLAPEADTMWYHKSLATENVTKMVQHKVIMRGRAVRSDGVIPSTAASVLFRIENSLHGAVDVAFRRTSASGRRQDWLRQAARVEFRDAERLGDNEMALYFQAPRFGDVAQQYYSEPKLFDDGPRQDDTAFDVLSGAVADVLAGMQDSDRYDVGLLKRFQKFESSVFDKEVDELIISGNHIPAASPRRLTRDFPSHAKDLYLKTPAPARARIAGKLDMIEASTLAFSLLLPGGEKVRGVWKGNDFETLRALVNSDVVATGMAIYRPSSALLRIDAETLNAQRDADRFFATVPVPSGGKLDLKSLMREHRKRGGIAGMWGQVPAEESDDEFLAAVANSD